MKIEIVVEHTTSPDSLIVNTVVVDQTGQVLVQKDLDLSLPCRNIQLEFELNHYDQNQIIDIEMITDSLTIQQYPLILKKITLDEFFDHPSLVYRGRPIYSADFLEMALQQGWCPDPAVEDSNRLDFSGRLVLRYQWPFYRNVFVIYP